MYSKPEVVSDANGGNVCQAWSTDRPLCCPLPDGTLSLRIRRLKKQEVV